jgi:hypothetical protein
MWQQFVMQLVRALRLGVLTEDSWNAVNQALGAIPQADREKAWRAALASYRVEQLIPGASANTVLSSLFEQSGWDVATEGVSPTGGADFSVKVTVKLSMQGGDAYRAVKVMVPFGAVVGDMSQILNAALLSMLHSYGVQDAQLVPGSWRIY